MAAVEVVPVGVSRPRRLRCLVAMELTLIMLAGLVQVWVAWQELKAARALNRLVRYKCGLGLAVVEAALQPRELLAQAALEAQEEEAVEVAALT